MFANFRDSSHLPPKKKILNKTMVDVEIKSHIYIYPRGPRFSDGEAVGLGGVGWGMVASCYVAATLMRPLGYICK